MAANAVWALAVVLVAGSLAFGQQRPEDKGKAKPDAKDKQTANPAVPRLEDLLAEAMRNNPDIQVAQAKLHEAEAKLNRARLQVMQKVMAFYHGLESQKAQVALAEKEYERIAVLARDGSVTPQIADAARQKLILAKTKLAEMEAELPYLLGKNPLHKEDKAEAELQRFRYHWAIARAHEQIAAANTLAKDLKERRQQLRGSVADKLRKALDAPVTLKAKGPLGEILEYLEDRASISFRIVSAKRGDIKDHQIDLLFKDRIPLGAALQAIQDTVPGLRFAVREYGILVTWEDALPPDALLVHDFWKGEEAKAKAKIDRAPDETGAPPKSNPPPKQVTGKITQVTPEGLVALDVGSDAGLAKGHTLDVFRLKPKPLYLGMIMIVDVQNKTAVGRPVKPTKEKMQVGDQVASQIMPRDR
jgi:hypothetical protein